MTHFVIEERRIEGERNREWRETSILSVPEEDALDWWKGYAAQPSPGWEARLVKVEETRTVLAGERVRRWVCSGATRPGRSTISTASGPTIAGRHRSGSARTATSAASEGENLRSDRAWTGKFPAARPKVQGSTA